jgi:hypothetical protein
VASPWAWPRTHSIRNVTSRLRDGYLGFLQAQLTLQRESHELQGVAGVAPSQLQRSVGLLPADGHAGLVAGCQARSAGEDGKVPVRMSKRKQVRLSCAFTSLRTCERTIYRCPSRPPVAGLRLQQPDLVGRRDDPSAARHAYRRA